jgi:hypothetical protein
MFRFHHLRFVALALPAYVVFQALSACTVTTTTNGTGGGTGSTVGQCPAGATEKKVGTQVYCCVSDGSGYSCSVGTLAKPGDPCAAEGATQSGAGVQLATDVCVEESCSGDRSCQEFPASVNESTGTLTCTGGVLQWSSAPATHQVVRACLVTQFKRCSSGLDSYSTLESGAYYQDAYVDNYAYTCGYGPYGGVPSVHVREVKLISSSCTPAGGTAADCPIGDL